MSNRWLLAAGTIALLLLTLPSGASAQIELEPHPSSRFWIHGEATTHDFTCRVTEVKGSARISAPQDTIRPVAHTTESDKGNEPEVEVRVPVRAFECGNSRMTRDLQETLEMKKHPEIRFNLLDATVKPTTDTLAEWSQVEVMGPLTISGTERLVRIDTRTRALGNGTFRIRGCLPVNMTYFGIEPPTKAFGLIRVQNEIRVQFDIVALVRSTENPSSPLVDPPNNPPPCDE